MDQKYKIKLTKHKRGRSSCFLWLRLHVPALASGRLKTMKKKKRQLQLVIRQFTRCVHATQRPITRLETVHKYVMKFKMKMNAHTWTAN